MELIIHGDVSKVENNRPGLGWSHVETDMYRNAKAVERIRSKLAKINLPGRIHLLFDHRADKSFASISQEAKDRLTPLMEPDMVNFFVRNNSGAERRHNPLTPWILLHRLHHSYEVCGTTDLPRSTRKLSTSSTVVEMENELRAVIGQPTVGNMSTDCHFSALACTMRSARVKQLNPFSLDIAAELFCQYHITGDIKFKGLDNWEFADHEYNFDKWGNHTGKIQFGNKMVGKFMHFYVTKCKNVKFTNEQKAKVDEIISRFKPMLINAIKYETEMMKTFPNVM